MAARNFTITQEGESRSFSIETGVGPRGIAGPAGPSASAPTIVDSSFTAAVDTYYNAIATLTVTDPAETPEEGKAFTVNVFDGTATVGGVAYSAVGTIVNRVYESDAWTSYVYKTSDQFAPAYPRAIAITGALTAYGSPVRILTLPLTGVTNGKPSYGDADGYGEEDRCFYNGTGWVLDSPPNTVSWSSTSDTDSPDLATNWTAGSDAGGTPVVSSADIVTALSVESGANFKAGSGKLTGPSSPLTIGTAAGNATGDFETPAGAQAKVDLVKIYSVLSVSEDFTGATEAILTSTAFEKLVVPDSTCTYGATLPVGTSADVGRELMISANFNDLIIFDGTGEIEGVQNGTIGTYRAVSWSGSYLVWRVVGIKSSLYAKKASEYHTGTHTFGSDVIIDGDLKFKYGSFYGSLNSTTLTGSRTYTLQDGTGTIAFTSDIASTINAGGTWAGNHIFSSTTRPTSAGTGTPAANSLITLADGDARFGRLFYAVQEADQSITTTDPTDATNLAVTLPVGDFFVMTDLYFTAASATPGVWELPVFSGTFSVDRVERGSTRLGYFYVSVLRNILGGAREQGQTDMTFYRRGFVRVSVAGTFKIQFYQDVSSGDAITLKAGSTIQFRKLN